MVPAPRLLRASSATAPALLYLLHPCSRALRPTGRTRFARTFKFVPDKFVELLSFELHEIHRSAGMSVFEENVELVPAPRLLRASCPPPLWGHLTTFDVQIRSRRICRTSSK